MVNYAALATKPTPQSRPLPGREKEMEKNDAGGYGFIVNPMQRLRRFLILGTDGGTFYASESDLTKQNFQGVKDAIKQHGIVAVQEIVKVSQDGLAMRNKPALFALALAASADDVETRRAALNAVHLVARTGSDLLYFVSQVKAFRGWGRALRRAIGNWFLRMPLDKLEVQAIKYRQREGWALADLLRLSHPATEDAQRHAVFKWLLKGNTEGVSDKLKFVTKPEDFDVIQMIKEHRLPREALRTEELKRVDVWHALLEDMPPHAMLRNLGKMTAIEALKPLAAPTKTVINTLMDAEFLKKSRMHPLAVLQARVVYGNGRGEKGSLTWSPVTAIMNALDQAFYSAFDDGISEKSAVIALDCSGSMTSERCLGVESMSASDGGAMLAMTLNRVFPNNQLVAFGTQLAMMNLSGQPSIGQVKSGIPDMGGTDCSLPFQYCDQSKLDPDMIIVITDNESWAGKSHAVEIISKLRKKKTDMKVVLVAMTAIRTSIVDNDPRNLEVVGFDASMAKLIVEFAEGKV